MRSLLFDLVIYDIFNLAIRFVAHRCHLLSITQQYLFLYLLVVVPCCFISLFDSQSRTSLALGTAVDIRFLFSRSENFYGTVYSEMDSGAEQ